MKKMAQQKHTTNWYQLEAEQVIKQLNTSRQGLAVSQVDDLLVEFGNNTLPEKKPKHPVLRFLAHFNDTLIYILLVAAVITAVMGHWVDTSVIIGVTVINALIGFIQENNAEQSLKSIQGMLSNTATVIRGGVTQSIDAIDLVPGDLVFLKPGVKIPADLRLIDAHNLQVEEAILTGESIAITKQTNMIEKDALLSDQLNMAFSGTTVSAGTALGIVVATGSQTQLGLINRMMDETISLRTPLLQQMDQLAKNILYAIVGLVVILFVLGYFLRDISLGELLIALISLSVAAVPEGLPAIISIILSIGVQTMARKKAIIRKIPTVETLGAMTVICSDKTGTLTMNEMVVENIILADARYQVTGNGYEPVGDIFNEQTLQQVELNQDQLLTYFLQAALLCNDSELNQDAQGQWHIIGGPTEAALKVLAIKSGIQVDSERISKIPFDSLYKYMSTCNKIGDETYIFVTGAPDVLFKLCDKQLTAKGEQAFDQAYWEQQIASYARKGLRMLGVVYREQAEAITKLEHSDIQQNMTFLGVAGIMDPPRSEAIEAIRLCQNAGINVKMITGDHPETALAIGAMLNIGNSKDVITGQELEQLDDNALITVANQYDVFARTSPEHKLRLVRALQANKEIVGMTGDGVNDAPALKQAEVGIAMGIKGTTVTKEAADMVLADDNFATIANAVQEGRRVYDNLKKTTYFILPSNLAQGLIVVIAIILGMGIPLTPLQILWMNMATSITLSFGLAAELAEPNVMSRPPRDAKGSILDKHAIWRILFVGILLAVSAFILEGYLAGKSDDVNLVRTVILQAIVAGQWVYMFNCRFQTKFPLDKTIFQNKWLWWVSGALILLQLAITYLPFMNSIFSTTPLPLSYWGIILLVSVVIFIIIELEKYIVSRFK